MKNIFALGLYTLIASTFLGHSNTSAAQELAKPIPSVTTAMVIERNITPETSFVGRVEAIEKVELRARVEGFLEQRLFQEGAQVNKGDLLFVIEKEPYEIVVAQSKADLSGAQATLKNAQSDLKRKKELKKKKVVSGASLDTSETNEATALANVMQAKASLRKAELNLSYTNIYSPLTGYISRSTYSVGNLVNSGSDPLATITSTDPIYVTVPISDKIVLEARRTSDLTTSPVIPHLVLSDGKAYEHQGKFNFLNTEVNQSTDSITARAVFPNPRRILVPGQFVNVLVRDKQAHKALTVPQASIQKDQQGYFVLTVNKSNKVEFRRIQVGKQLEKDWVVTEGLDKGEKVIVQGVQKVRPDMAVNPVDGGT